MMEWRRNKKKKSDKKFEKFPKIIKDVYKKNGGDMNADESLQEMNPNFQLSQYLISDYCIL